MSFPRYPKYKPSGVEWPGEVPEGWAAHPLDAIDADLKASTDRILTMIGGLTQ